MGRALWSDLPKELLEILSDHLHTKTDVSRFRSVCESWRFSTLPFKNSLLLPQTVSYLGPDYPRKHLLFLTESTVYHLSPPEADRAITSTWSLWGWLVKLKQGQQPGQLHLINPLSPLQIQPLPDSFPKVIDSLQFRVFELAKSYTLQFSNLDHCNYKVALLPNPECPSLMIIITGMLWHLNLGHDTWTPIADVISILLYEDVILYQGKFCAVDELGRTILIDSSMNVTEVASSTPEMARGDKKNLVESNGELLLVDKYLCIENKSFPWKKSSKVQTFKVFKLKLDQHRWVEVQSLDDQILFLGHDCSFSVSAQYFGGCKGNCILYADPCFMVFNLDEGSHSPVDQHPEYASIFYPPSTWPPRPRTSPGWPTSKHYSGKPAAKKQQGLANNQ